MILSIKTALKRAKVRALRLYESSKLLRLLLFVVITYLLTRISMIFIVPISLYLGLYLILLLVTSFNTAFGTKISKQHNIIVYGSKGTGKDLMTQLIVIKRYKKAYIKRVKKIKKELKKQGQYNVIELQKKVTDYFNEHPLYLSNMDYGYGGKIVELKQLNVGVNTYDNMIDNNPVIIEKNELMEGLDYYHSDTGIALPSFADNKLTKDYIGLALYYPLSRQLYNQNIMFNSQALPRVWIKLREQQDGFIKLLGTVPANKSLLKKLWKFLPLFRNHLFIKARYYEIFESAQAGIMPFKSINAIGKTASPLYLTAGTATQKEYDAKNGKIKNLLMMITIKEIRYDTRYYHQLFFGKPAPKS